MKLITKSFKFRIYPNSTQEVLLAKTFGCTRWLFNRLLAETKQNFKDKKKFNSKIDNNNYCNRQLKVDHPWLKEVDKFALTYSIYALDNAYQNFFREIKKGNHQQGLPKWKTRHDHYFSYKTSFTNNNIQIKDERIKLPKLGWLNAKFSQNVSGKILNATVSKTCSGKYFVALCCENVPIKQLPAKVNLLGIDLGIKDFAVCSNQQVITNPKFLTKLECKLAKAQRKMAKKAKQSSNRNKQRIKVNLIYEKINNQKTNFLQQLSTKIITENQSVVLEDLAVKNMLKNHKLAKAISQVSWSRFVTLLEYKADWYGREIIRVDKFFPSSQLCSNCGCKNSQVKDLKLRQWKCTDCGILHDRDFNAALNLHNEGLRLKNIRQELA